MDDRELLELAAKAVDLQWMSFGDNGAWIAGRETLWNPLTDDGDALRLANKLRMRIEHHVRHPFVAVFAGKDFDAVKAEEPHEVDVDAATRRAIVRAAAEIGRAM
ncbi:hypothetical protein NAV11_20220 [Pseudomonas songnenensis]|uniref:Phage ABA sandwich domain-containing protein n=1 Tax=Pseudomonas songnenensis TaxID=1176259 RepID=A0ABX9UQN4_9PSED|nr:hypothetical protein [Pseudomonas songnenensis]MCQ4302246.1 hypothetical protein [Pseudomonas songnenensis]RMH95406.1 hypothetical protein EA798_16570 [Pseudomonas songnenensis]